MKISVLLPLLIVLGMSFSVAQDSKPGLRTWTAINGKEVEAEFVSNEKGIVKLKLKSGKIFEVPANKLSKEDNEFISSLAQSDGVPDERLEQRKGIMYLKGSDTPYTGKSYSLHPNGQKAAAANFKDGKPDGLAVWWYPNGQKSGEENYKDDKPDGLQVAWYENGQKKSQVAYKDGKREGLDMAWYENGQKEWERNFKDGKANGLQVRWHENGQKKIEASVKDGKAVAGTEKYWNSKGEPVDTIQEALKE